MVKAMTLIKNVYAEELKPMGYVKVKSKHPYFAKMLTPEIFAVIAIEKERYCSISPYEDTEFYLKECGEFHIYCGIGTVYKKNIDFDKDIEDNKRWLLGMRDIYRADNPEKIGEYDEELYSFIYDKNDKDSIVRSARKSIDIIKKYAFGKFDEINSLEKALKFLEKYNSSILYLGKYCDQDIDYCNVIDEGILYIKTENHDDLNELYERNCRKEYYAVISPNTGYKMEDYEEVCEIIAEFRKNIVANRDKIFEDRTVYSQVLGELERRKNYNCEKLKKYGILHNI